MIEQRNINMRKVLKIALIIAAIVLGIFLAYRLSHYLAPFIIAFIISSLLEPFIRFLVKKAKIPRKIVVPVTLLLFLFAFAVIITLVIVKLINEIKDMSRALPGFLSSLYDNMNTLADRAVNLYEWLPEEVAVNVETVIVNLAGSLMNMVNSLVNTVVKGAYTTAVSIPEILIFILVTIMSTYFLASDRDRISNFFRSQFPDVWVDKAVTLKNDMFSAMFAYLRAILILMCITFTELLIGFSIIRVKYVLLLAFIVSVVDVLPVLGTGTVLIPWAIYEFLTGNMRMGISIVVLYLIVLIIRQLIEPRIVGGQIGIYPLLTLIAMYSGLKLIGFAGLILGPITLLLLKNIITGMLKSRTIKEIIDIKKPS